MTQMNLGLLADAEQSYQKSIMRDLLREQELDGTEAALLRQKLTLYGETLLWQNKTKEAREVYSAMVTSGHLEHELERPMTSFSDRRVFGRASPWFHAEEIAERFPALDAVRQMFEGNASTLRREFLAYRRAYPELVQTHPDALVAMPRDGWQQLPVEAEAVGEEKELAQDCRGLCPKTAELLLEVQRRLCFGEVCPRKAEFSILRPGTKLRPHTGPTNLSVTLHFGLVVPSGRYAFCLGAGECQTWKEGKLFVFNEAFEHWASGSSAGANGSTHTDLFEENERAVLLFKIPHPGLPQDVYREHYNNYLRNSSLFREVVDLGEALLLEKLGAAKGRQLDL